MSTHGVRRSGSGCTPPCCLATRLRAGGLVSAAHHSARPTAVAPPCLSVRGCPRRPITSLLRAGGRP
eukprot:14324996-Alexandrium_andersonii.AAC.1